MPGLDHVPQPPNADDDIRTAARNARYGLILFALYLVLYAAFVLVNAFWPSLMETTFAGLNLAILYGLGLIAAAFVLALAYVWLCRSPADAEGRP